MSGAGVVVLALGSALAAATSSVLQHRSARQAPSGRAHRLLGHLLTRPAWIAGAIAAAIGLVLHAWALAGGQLAVVQPLLISGVLFALPVSALLEHRRPSAKEWITAVVVVAGLAAFLIAAHPATGKVALDADVLAGAATAGAAVVGLLGLVGWRWPHGHARALLGSAAGIGFGVVAALLKQCSALAHNGIVALLADWPLYALIAMGAVSIVMNQFAFRAGPLAHSMPALTVTDPVASVALGALAFHEALAATPLALTIETLGFVAMTGAAADLARRSESVE